MSSYAQTIWNYLKAKLGNEYGAAGLMGNLEAESGLLPNNLENSYETSSGYTDSSYTAAVDDGSYSKNSFVNDWYGYGLAQWTYPSRKQALYELWKSGGYSSISSINLQLDYLYHELETDYSGVLAVLKSATSIREASDKVLHDFENPADQSESVEAYRASLGQAWYNQFTGTGGEIDPDPGPDPDDPSGEILFKKRAGYNFLVMTAERRRRLWQQSARSSLRRR